MFLLTLCNVIFGAVIFEHTQKPEAVCFAIVSGIAAAFFISDGVFLLNNEEICWDSYKNEFVVLCSISISFSLKKADNPYKGPN